MGGAGNSQLGLGLAMLSPNVAETKGCGPVATVYSVHSVVVDASRRGCCTQSLLGLGLAMLSTNMAETKGCGLVVTIWGVHSTVVDASGRGWMGIYCCTQSCVGMAN